MRDDGYRVEETIAQARDLLETLRPIVLIGFAGTSNITELLGSGLLEAHRTYMVDPQELVQLAGIENVHGLGISQVMPYPYTGLVPIVREYRDALSRFAPAGTPPTYTSLETFVAARVLTEALKRQGENPRPHELGAALEGVGYFDVGGFEVEFGPNRRQGSTFVDITVIGRTGQLMR